MAIPMMHPMRPARRDSVRDGVIDLLRMKPPKQVIDEALRRMRDLKREPDPFVRRRKWCLMQLHSTAELRQMAERALDQLGPLPVPVELDIAGGEEWSVQEASLWDAVAGIPDGHAMGGSWGDADDVEWGEEYLDYATDDLADAERMAAALDANEVPNTGVYPGPDGRYHVSTDLSGSD